VNHSPRLKKTTTVFYLVFRWHSTNLVQGNCVVWHDVVGLLANSRDGFRSTLENWVTVPTRFTQNRTAPQVIAQVMFADDLLDGTSLGLPYEDFLRSQRFHFYTHGKTHTVKDSKTTKGNDL
jgi:hypothetical protein